MPLIVLAIKSRIPKGIRLLLSCRGLNPDTNLLTEQERPRGQRERQRQQPERRRQRQEQQRQQQVQRRQEQQRRKRQELLARRREQELQRELPQERVRVLERVLPSCHKRRVQQQRSGRPERESSSFRFSYLDRQNLEKPRRQATLAHARIGTMHLVAPFLGTAPDYIGI